MPITAEQASARRERQVYGGQKPRGQAGWNRFAKAEASREAKNPTPWRYDQWGILRGPTGAQPPSGMPSRGEPGALAGGSAFDAFFGGAFGGASGGGAAGSAGGAGGGAAGGVGGAGGAGAGAGAGTSNVAEISPFLKEQIERYRSRFGSDPTERAIQRSNLGIADAAALLAADAKANMASRGVLNTGTGATFLQRRVFEPAQRQAAGRAADIAMGRERDLDALVLGGTGLMTAPDAIALAAQGMNLQSQAQAADQAFRANQAEEERKWRTTQMLMDLYRDAMQAPQFTAGWPGGYLT